MQTFVQQSRNRLLFTATVLAATVAIAGCGGSDVEEQPTPVSQMQSGTDGNDNAMSGDAPRAVEQDAPMASKPIDSAAP